MDDQAIVDEANAFIIGIPPERLEHWKKRYPVHWREILEILVADEIFQRGGANPKLSLLACYRTWDLMLSLYDLASPTERIKQVWRRKLRELLAEHPNIEEMYPAFRWRLNEHDQWVKYGMDELDPDEKEQCRGTA